MVYGSISHRKLYIIIFISSKIWYYFYGDNMNKGLLISNNKIYDKKGRELCKNESVILYTPKILSFFDNTVPTMTLFKRARMFLECSNCYKLIYNLKNVEKITIDVIMYMVALSNDIRRDKPFIQFALSLPTKEDTKNFVKKCGLKQFVKGNNDYIVEDCKDYYTIAIGSKADPLITKSICEFVYPFLGINKSDGFFLYNTFIELMNNAEQHAYDFNRDDKKWFTFVENTNDKIKFTFLDTGIGIPNTVFKKTTYKTNGFDALDLIDLAENKDARFIFSALIRENKRSQTRLDNRGHGLPEIYSYYRDGKYTSNLKIISGHGICMFSDNEREKPILINMDQKFHGTLFFWEINKFNFSKEVQKYD